MSGKILQIVTNNPEIYRGPEMPYGIVFADGSPMDVLDKTEELLQQGWRLLSAPLPPNIPLMRGPYRSLVIVESDSRYDAAGLKAIDKARMRYGMERAAGCRTASGSDFAIIDHIMLQRTLKDISLLNT